MRPRIAAMFGIVLLLSSSSGHAQTSTEDRLREAVKRLTADLRAAQDAQRPLQQKLEDATRQRDSLQSQLEAAKADFDRQAAATKQAEAQIQSLQTSLDGMRKDSAALQAALAKWQAAYKQAAAIAQARDAEARRLDATLSATRETLEAAKLANKKLVAAARDILHLYETQSFRTLLVQSYEPLLGLKRTQLENMVQDYEDRIEDGRLVAPPAGAPPSRTQ